jgi:peptidyl-prolyl cis-trans isomerase A (cyclophilin A)
MIKTFTSHFLAAIAGMVLLAGCAATRTPALPAQPQPSPLLDPASPVVNQTAPPRFKVLFETTQGDFVVEVHREWAPHGADRFFNLVLHGFYDSARFFRNVRGFMVQFGIPGDALVAAAWREARMPDDSVRQSNRRGYVTFATAGPDTRTSQVFINLADNLWLDARGFAPFGVVVGGMDTIERLYAEYGDAPPRGRGPVQERIQAEGNVYLEREFPLLDYIVGAGIIAR